MYYVRACATWRGWDCRQVGLVEHRDRLTLTADRDHHHNGCCSASILKGCMYVLWSLSPSRHRSADDDAFDELDVELRTAPPFDGVSDV